ncbi:Pimeloyl-ACP methyl ester carboxylesterase [Salinimicrobium catena]|uniref:Pimeloyl-ACP methyl ester carboxylesterase n=1 Tax=Salinimicrobium catena TaxID=390640 RepID=A0A1H5NVT0_9FLAO|nr:alpha/beta hydrolase [Salinimicrobium catena]SDL59567.1 Pimeloyl-ACP methyl ester carboxylesterase [Salinimicrobium catena]SEF05752.1 Pimeloyl-ACP methyl ester carboxylesterase [Salinimicrobium catena]
MTAKTKDNTPVQRLLVPSYILAISKLLTIVSPFLASRFAAKLFLTPFRYKLPEREREMDENSRQTKLTVPSINREVVVYEYGDSSRKILLAHGWSGRGTQLSVMAKTLLQQGYSVVSFDAPAHGKAPGKWSMMPFFIETIHYLEQEYGPFEAAIGHSLGGMSCLKAVKDGLDIEKLVIIGTANSVTHITREFAHNMKMNEKVAKKMKKYFDRKFGEDMDNYSGAVSAKNVHIPTLVIHDEHDVDVHISSAHEITENLENGELYITEELGHRRILGDQKVINKIIEFLSV